MRLLARAKVNLFLHVLNKREDGYHELHTLFERVSLCDEVTLKPLSAGIRVRSNNPSLSTGPKNVVYQAAKLLKDKFAVKSGISIYIRKRIPVQGGLGGGSSDAAAVLLGLNKLWKLGLSKYKLCELGAQIGSDVPFFILETSFAEARGRGEILIPLRMKRTKFWHIIIKPPFGISTKQAYEALSDRFQDSTGDAPGAGRPIRAERTLVTRARLPQRQDPSNLEGLTAQNADARMLLRALRKGHAGRLQELCQNSLEVTGNKQLKVIFKLKNELLEQGALAGLMSGSGSSVFGLFGTRTQAETAARFFRKRKSLKVFVVKTI